MLVLICAAAAMAAEPPAATRPADDLAAIEASLPELAVRTDDAGRLEFFRQKLMWIELAALKRSEPYALRLMYLQGGRQDRKALDDLTSPAVLELAQLTKQIDATHAAWKADVRKLAAGLPELETIRRQLRYQGAWLLFYRALAVDDGPERTSLLRQALAGAETAAGGDEMSGARQWSQLLAGMCARRLKDSDRAEAMLAQAAAAQSPPAARAQAIFESACELIDRGKFADATRGVKDFHDRGLELLGPARQLEIDVKTTMLLVELFERQAVAAGDPAAGEYRQAAQRAPIELLGKYDGRSDVKAAMIEVLAARYCDSSRPESEFSSLVLLGVARQRRAEREADSLDRAEQLLRMVLDRDDELSRSLRGEALWELAMTAGGRGMNLEAGRLFLQLAAGQPEHPLARDAARNALQSLSGEIEARQQANGPVAPSLRLEFIAAIQAALARWGGEEDFAAWNYELGRQCQTLAGDSDCAMMQKAADAYARVPATASESAEARRAERELRARLWELRIAELLERDQIADAIEMFDAFRSQHPAKTQAATQLLVQRLRARVDRLRGDPAGAAELAVCRAGFYRLGGELHAAAAEQDLSSDQRYALDQMWAEALLAGGRAEEALAEFQSCAARDAQRRQAAGRAVDAANLVGLARCNRELKRFEEAAKYYRQLAAGVDKSEHAELYWQIQLERCACLREAFEGDAERMGQLRTLLRQLRLEDRRMGGLADGFAAIEPASRPSERALK